MRNSAEDKLFEELGRRLDNYSELPDDAVWGRISGSISNKPDIRMKAYPMAAAVVILAMMLVGSFQPLPVPSVAGSASVDAGKDPRKAQIASLSPAASKHAHETGHLRPSATEAAARIEKTESNLHAATTAGPSAPMIARAYTESSDMSAPADAVEEYNNEEILPNLEASAEVKIKLRSVASILPLPASEASTPDETIIPQKKMRKKTTGFRLYALVAPALSFLKTNPFRGDATYVTGVDKQPFLTSKRSGVTIEAGVQRTVLPRLEVFAGVNYYQQTQQVGYTYGTAETGNAVFYEKFNYSMKNAGVHTGVLYTLASNKKLTMKAGGEVAWQKGLLTAGKGDSYSNAKSEYVMGTALYRAEYEVTPSVKVFVQPSFSYSIAEKQTLNEPFVARPYRAGVGFGAIVAL